MTDAATDPARLNLALRLGDDALVLGQRLGEWCGHAPTLEVDLSLTNIALDLVGQAQHFLAYAGELEGGGRDADAMAFRRDVFDFRNCLLVEQPNGDFARTMVRQLLFSTWQHLLMEQLATVSDPRLAEVGAKAVKETAYHARLASDWVVRLGDGTDESRDRTIDGLNWCWRFVDELFEDDAEGAELVSSGVGVDVAALRPAWDDQVGSVLQRAGLTPPTVGRGVTGGRAGRHSEHLGHMLGDMQFLARAYPDAVW